MPLTAQFVRNLQRFRLVTFDVTDTLLRLKEPTKQYAETAEACGISGINKSQLERCFRQQFKLMSRTHTNFGRCTPDMNWQAWWRQVVINTFTCADASLSRAQLQTVAEQLLLIFRTSACWTHIEGATDFVQRVREAGKCVGIISNFDPSLHQVLSAMGFNDKFDFILNSYDAGAMKPDPAIFQLALQGRNIAPAQALHIGNQLDMDYTGARNSGWSSLLVQQQQPEPAAAGHTYASLAEMLQALETRQIAW
ncbi:rhythmically expressed gene 2 protein [Drosophila novamexicana]|uniref:rhythmically expressed gene 2 protein n=1 Tax=Drosophila novamexicana TaxID=47314 RepID=UPI0011E5D52E|nr:rhythmically expressed gene 2 protein [Drosophila novamexicana]